jgi:hypothetical protein
MSDLLLTRTTFLGLLLAESKLPRIPAEPWPLEGAVEALAGNPRGGRLAQAATKWLAPEPSANGRVQGVARWARDASTAGLLSPEGEGWAAGYRPVGDWVERTGAIREQLGEDELGALIDAAQRLVAMASMLSKKLAA